MLLLTQPPPKVIFPFVNSNNWYQSKVLTRKRLIAWRKGLKMEVYKLGKVIENQVIDIQLFPHNLEEAREELRKSLKRRREIVIAKK